MIDNEDGSVAMILWIPATLFLGLFLWVSLSKVFDLLTNFQNHWALANPNMPVSPDRVMYTQWMIWGWQSLLLFAIVLPVLYYAIIVARRKTNSNI